MNANDYLAQVSARADAATSGPWEAYNANEGMSEFGPLWCVANEEFHNPSGDEDSECVDVEIGFGDKPDADFIAAAREDVPRMAAALREVLGVHLEVQHGEYAVCDECGYSYPCLTVEAITEMLGVD